MKDKNNRQLRMSELLFYFEKENLQVPKTLAENLYQFNQTLELLNEFKPHLKSVLIKKTFHFEQLKEFNQDLNEIKTILLKLEAIHDGNDQSFTKISNIADDSSNLIKKTHYLSDLVVGMYVKDFGISNCNFKIMKQY